MPKPLLFLCVFMMSLIGFVGCKESTPPKESTDDEPPVKIIDAAPAKVETQPPLEIAKKWDRINNLMSPQEFVEILGKPHRDITESAGNDYHHFRYEWDEAGTTYCAFFNVNFVIFTKTRPVGTPFKRQN